MTRPDYVRAAEHARMAEEDAVEDARLARVALEAELVAQGVRRWWPHRVPGMSDHVWLDELAKAARRRQGGSFVSRDRDIESGRRRMR